MKYWLFYLLLGLPAFDKFAGMPPETAGMPLISVSKPNMWMAWLQLSAR